MIGKTNIPMGMSKGETVSILLKTNQSSNEDLNGVKVVVSYNDESHEYAYNGQFSVEIPNGKAYTVSFGEVEGYKTPSSVTYTAVKGFSRSVEVTYSSEFLTLNVTGTSTPVVTIKKAKEVGVSEKYKVVDYIETNGTQYIDTGFKPNQNTRVVVDFKADNTAQHVWGSRIEWRNNSFLCCWENNFDWCVQINAANFNGGSFDAKARHTVEMSCAEFKVDGTTTATYSVDAFQCTNNLLIASVQNSEQSENFVGKYYSFKVYDGNNLVRDYVPVKNSQGVYGLYDRINDTFSPSTGSLAGGGYIYDETIATQTSVSGLHKIAYDTEYIVEASAVDGFTTPEVQYYTANQPSRNVSVDYLLAEERVTVNVSTEDGAGVDGQTVFVDTGVPSEGVYIEDTSYKLWTADEWDNSATANSIVVSDGSMARRIALTIISYRQMGEINFPDEMEAISDSNLAIQDFDGKSNTNILKENNNDPTADYYILYYIPFIFPDGVTKGYIPALGELYFLYQKKTEISEALSACGGDEWDGTGNGMSSYIAYDFYSSTRAYYATTDSKNYVWFLNWNTGELDFRVPSGNVNPGNARAMSEYNVPHAITNGKASFSIPYNETYTVSLSDMDGYTTTASQTYTASQPTREISMEYKKAVEHVIVNVSSDDYTDMDGYKVYVRPNVVNGAYIQDVDGNLYTESEWDTMKVANGIAVVTDECSFVIALEYAREDVKFSTYGDDISLTISPYTEEAVLDFNGLGNTNNIISTSYDANNAAQYCRDYIFPNGQSGYLGAAGEWNAVMNSLDEIEELLSVIGGESFEDWCWISTGYDENGTFYIFNPINNFIAGQEYYNLNHVRAFAELGSSYTITNGKVEFDVPAGVDYTISVEDVDGYTTPEPQSFVAESGTRTVDMVYEAVKLGVFIATQAGELIDPNNWTSSSGTAVGVAVCTENSKYIISRTSYHGNYISWSSSTTIDMSNVPSSTYSFTIATYYDGVSYTDAMLGYNSSTSYSAGFARSKTITFGNTVLSGYLGSAGEWMDAVNNHQAVMDAFEKLGETFVADGYYKYFWTSCEYNSTAAWCAYWYEDSNSWGLNSYSKSRKTSLYYTVPFFKI